MSKNYLVTGIILFQFNSIAIAIIPTRNRNTRSNLNHPGANKGIGLACVEAILEKDDNSKVLLGSRDLARGEAAKAELVNPCKLVRIRIQHNFLKYCFCFVFLVSLSK